MRSDYRGQSGQSGDDRGQPFAHHWTQLTAQTIRVFAQELCARNGLRGAATLTGLSKEGLRKIAAGVVRPNLKSRQALGELCLNRYPGGMIYNEVDGRWLIRKPLIELLPDGEGEAELALVEVFEMVKRFPDEVPPYLDDVMLWLLAQVKAEYAGKRANDELAKKPRDPKKKQPPAGEP